MRRTRCPICRRARDDAPDAAAAELPDAFAHNQLLVIAYDALVTTYGIPCVRCTDRAVTALRQRGPLAAAGYLTTAALTARAVGRRRLRGRRDRSARHRN